MEKVSSRLLFSSQQPLKNGFTLVELLVVIAIIGVLMGLLVPAIGLVQTKSLVNQAQNDINQLSLGCESYNAEYGDYPPSSLQDRFEDYSSNGICEGIESLLACLTTKSKGGPFFEFKEAKLENLDGDSVTLSAMSEKLNWVFGDDQLREYCDPFGQPYVYIHNSGYDRIHKIYEIDKASANAQAGRSAKTATYHSLSSFQIWSLGVDGLNQNGARLSDEPQGDDIGSWN